MAPGSGAYCTSSCDTYCAEVGDDYQKDVVRGEATPAADTSKCDAYKTDAAKKYCGEQAVSKAKATRAAAAAEDASPLAMNNGIFGDSGVTYSKGVEELCGATSRPKPECCHASSEAAQGCGCWRPRLAAPRCRLGHPLAPVQPAGRPPGRTLAGPFFGNCGLLALALASHLAPPTPARRAGSGSSSAPTVRTRTSPRPTWASSEATSPTPPRRPSRANP